MPRRQTEQKGHGALLMCFSAPIGQSGNDQSAFKTGLAARATAPIPNWTPGKSVCTADRAEMLVGGYPASCTTEFLGKSRRIHADSRLEPRRNHQCFPFGTVRTGCISVDQEDRNMRHLVAHHLTQQRLSRFEDRNDRETPEGAGWP